VHIAQSTAAEPVQLAFQVVQGLYRHSRVISPGERDVRLRLQNPPLGSELLFVGSDGQRLYYPQVFSNSSASASGRVSYSFALLVR
jgi:hypothetical protein